MQKLINADNVEQLSRFIPNSFDSVITDPPYGIKFMNKKWDVDCPSVELWQECFRVLKSGGHLLSFSGTRNIDFIMGRIRDAGFEIRDTVTWLYGSGFPKSHNIGKAIDKKQGNERESLGLSQNRRRSHELGESWKQTSPDSMNYCETKGNSEWEGWGTALKPACEFIVVARKPFKGAVADNVLKHGTGAMNIDACRVETDEVKEENTIHSDKAFWHNGKGGVKRHTGNGTSHAKGRFPANLILDEEAGEMLDEQSGVSKSTGGRIGNKPPSHETNLPLSGGYIKGDAGFGDKGGASRFFYCAKASKSERNKGLEGMEEKERSGINKMMGCSENNPMKTGSGNERTNKMQNHHPTVKPIKLMEYLCKLVTPPNGTILDPFMGSGTTGLAAKNLGFNFIGIELNKEYYEIAKQRLKGAA